MSNLVTLAYPTMCFTVLRHEPTRGTGAMSKNPPPSVIEDIPPVVVVHERLGRALREVSMLRSLLRLAKRAEESRKIEARQSQQAVNPTAGATP